MSKIDLRQGDCLELMKSIPDGSVDMVLCDLPYGITSCKWDKRIELEPLWEQYDRIAKKNAPVVLFSTMLFAVDLINSNRKNFKYEWIWDRKGLTGFLNAKRRPLKRTEIILIFCNTTPVYFPVQKIGKYRKKGGCKTGSINIYKANKNISTYNNLYYPQNILEYSTANHNKRFHPTQKPVALLEYLIRTYTLEGETVLDNCMGSGSTGVACKHLNRNFIGFELDETYFNIAVKRIEEADNEK